MTRTGSTGPPGGERGSYPKWAKVKLDKVHLEKRYGYAVGDLSAAYPDDLGKLELRRHVVMARDFVLLLDEMSGEKPHVFTSLLHTDNEITRAGGENVYQTVIDGARLLIYVLSPDKPVIAAEKAIVFGGRGPTGGSDQHRGYRWSLRTAEPVRKAVYVTLLVPQKASAPRPTGVRLVAMDEDRVTVEIDRPDGKTVLTLDRKWSPGRDNGPGRVEVAPPGGVGKQSPSCHGTFTLPASVSSPTGWTRSRKPSRRPSGRSTSSPTAPISSSCPRRSSVSAASVAAAPTASSISPNRWTARPSSGWPPGPANTAAT